MLPSGIYMWIELSIEIVLLGGHCQRYANFNSNPVVELKSIVIPERERYCKYVVVVVDYFTKWVEAGALATITASYLREFIYRAIVCRYRIYTLQVDL